MIVDAIGVKDTRRTRQGSQELTEIETTIIVPSWV